MKPGDRVFWVFEGDDDIREGILAPPNVGQPEAAAHVIVGPGGVGYFWVDRASLRSTREEADADLPRPGGEWTADAIVRSIAADPPPEGDRGGCFYCGREAPTHSRCCLWRRAAEWVAANPERKP